jgi:hypothetical protein
MKAQKLPHDTKIARLLAMFNYYGVPPVLLVFLMMFMRTCHFGHPALSASC